MIEKIIPGTKTKLRILKNIYETPGIKLTELIKKSHCSPNVVLGYVNSLEDFGVLSSSKLTGKKRAIREIFLNSSSELSLILLSLVEIDKRNELFAKYKKLRVLSEQLKSSGEFALIYGSYARKSPDKESDIDLIIVGDNLDKNKITESLITFPEVSLKVETKKQFLGNLEKPLYKNILREGIVLFGEMNFLKIVKRGVRK